HVFARLYRGVLRPGDNVSYKKPDGRMANEHVARIFDVDAAKKSRLNMAHAGEIVLLAGLRHVATGDTLCEPDHPLLLERIDTREPVLSLAIEPGSSDQEEKFLEVMEKLQEEDPTLRFGEDADTGQRLLSGMGELHLQIIIERLEREYNLLVKAGKPAVALRETVTKSSRIDHLFQPPAERANGDLELKARVVLSISPRERGSGVQTSIEPLVLPEGSHLNPAQRESLEQGLLFSLGGGPLEGAPLQDLQVDIEEVEIFGSSSTPAALSATISRAVAKALHNAKPALLQPIMSAEVVVPEANLGSVLGDLQSRHAIIRDTQHNKEDASISCEVALAELLGYTTQLRSMTQGRGQFSTIFKRFDTA
ncbi:MAG: GTP-binding protein, partial [Gammaproteobacteria bacterium]|nr:GTP-binding protein [Gammaproteobacteria bacterium]